MKLLRTVLLFSAIALAVNLVGVSCAGNEEDDDFAEFDDDFEEDESPVFQKNREKQTPQSFAGQKDPVKKEGLPNEDSFIPQDSEKAKESVQESNFDDDDEVLVEDDDFEGIDDDDFDDESDGKRREMPPPKLTITPVPIPIRGWQAYWSELLMLSGIAVYMVNYILGRYKNQKIAQTFFDINWSLLEENFAILGDSTKLEEEQGNRGYQKMSDSVYQMWCSGRVCCEGMLVELKLLKRQDLVSILAHIFRPTKDVLRLSVEMAREEIDDIVFAVANKRTALKISKEYNDLANYCPDKKPGEKFGLPSQFVVLSELSEVVSAMLDSRTCAVIDKFSHVIDSIHFSDQFTGLKSADPDVSKDGVMKMPEAKHYLFFTFNLPTSNSGGNCEEVFEEIKPLLQFVFHCIDKVKRFRLSREGKMKAERNRAKVEEAYMKQTHAARAEAAAVRREEKRRQEKERILQEEDPEKQRRWEEKELKREKKRKQPKMKQLKVKAL